MVIDFFLLLAMEEARLVVVDYKLEVLCYATKDLPLTCAVSKLIIPGLVDQLHTMKKIILPNLLTQHPQVRCQFNIFYYILSDPVSYRMNAHMDVDVCVLV